LRRCGLRGVIGFDCNNYYTIAGCAVFSVIFELLGVAYGAAAPPLIYLIALFFGPIVIQSFIYCFITKSVDGVQITGLHAFILSIIFFLPGSLSIIAAMIAMEALIGDFIY
jgi:hypothetical protein